jgi:hypothetical protein
MAFAIDSASRVHYIHLTTHLFDAYENYDLNDPAFSEPYPVRSIRSGPAH